MKLPNKTVTAIIAIAVVLIIALLKGIDAVLLTAGIGAIAGLGGFVAGRTTKPK